VLALCTLGAQMSWLPPS